MAHYILLSIIACLSFYLRGETQERYTLYPTQNMWTFLKLDTATGQIRHVQYGMELKERFEYELSELDITSLIGKKHIKGRYKLYPTQNRWTFILLDTLDGNTFQVQWGEDCGIVPILPGTIKRSEDDEPTKHDNATPKDELDKEESQVNFFDLFK